MKISRGILAVGICIIAPQNGASCSFREGLLAVLTVSTDREAGKDWNAPTHGVVISSTGRLPETVT